MRYIAKNKDMDAHTWSVRIINRYPLMEPDTSC